MRLYGLWLKDEEQYLQFVDWDNKCCAFRFYDKKEDAVRKSKSLSRMGIKHQINVVKIW